MTGETVDGLSLERRSDAEGKASGRARYTQDFYRPGMLHGIVVRSTVASAAIEGVDLTRAREVDGAVVLGSDDVPGTPFGDVEPDEPLLATGRVRYVGEPVALVGARTREEAETAAALVTVDYAPRPAATTLDEALAAGAPSVHDGEANVGDGSSVARGDTASIFSEADHVVTTTVRTHRVHQGYIEPRVSLAELDPDGRLVVTTCSQAPFQVREALARVFGLPLNEVIVRVPAFGGGFGGKLHAGMALYAGALCLESGSPVQVVSSRAEEMQAGNPRENSRVMLESALSSDGRILARRVQGYFDSGAYTYDTPYITSMGAMQAAGAYAIEAVEGSVRPVRTNTQPTGSFRAPSGPQMCFANEAHMDEIADRLGIDRIDLRRRNLMGPGDRGPTGQQIARSSLATCLDEGEALIDVWKAEKTSSAESESLAWGYGLACHWWFTAPGASSASVRVEEDGTATVSCGATEIGTGAVVSALGKLVAAELGLAADRVRLITGNTESTPPDYGSEGSRTMYGAGNAVVRAACVCKDILLDCATREFEADAEDLVFRDGLVGVVGSPDSFRPLGELVALASAAGGQVVGSGRFQAPEVPYEAGCATGMLIPTFNEPTFHCHAAQVAIDRALGTVRVVRYAAVHDTGTIVNWAGVKGQIEGGVVQGLGYALHEEMLLDGDGRVRNADLVDYRLPTIADIPDRLDTIPVQDFPSESGPRGAKGIGEAPVILPAATIASAVRDATNSPVFELPITPERVVAALRDGAGDDR